MHVAEEVRVAPRSVPWLTTSHTDMLVCNNPSCKFTFCLQCMEQVRWLHFAALLVPYSRFCSVARRLDMRAVQAVEAREQRGGPALRHVGRSQHQEVSQVPSQDREGWYAAIAPAVCMHSRKYTGGCNHMTCGSCSHEFCWLCMKDYSDDHFSDGGCEQYT